MLHEGGVVSQGPDLVEVQAQPVRGGVWVGRACSALPVQGFGELAFKQAMPLVCVGLEKYGEFLHACDLVLPRLEGESVWI